MESRSRRLYIKKTVLYKEATVALSLKDPETDRLAREVSKLTGESITRAVRIALAERLDRERLRRGLPKKSLAEELDALAKELPALADLDSGADAIDYDENGMWR
jgi:antitoxin VapB